MLPVMTALAPMAGATGASLGAGLGSLGSFLGGLGGLTEGGLGGLFGGGLQGLTGLPFTQLTGGAGTPMSSIGGLLSLLGGGNLGNIGMATMLGGMGGAGTGGQSQQTPEDIANLMASSTNPIPVDVGGAVPLPDANNMGMIQPVNTQFDPRMLGLLPQLANNRNSREI